MENSLNRIKELITNAWDWPDVAENNLTEKDYHKFKKLSLIFASMAIATTLAVMQLNGYSILQTIFFSSLSWIIANYAAGKVVQYDVRKRNFESKKKIVYSLYKMNRLFNFLEINLIAAPTGESIARLQCLEKELIEEDEAIETFFELPPT